jgi:hypothetical protein
MINLYKKNFEIVQLFEMQELAKLFALKLKTIKIDAKIESRIYKNNKYYFVISLKRINKKLLEKVKRIIILYEKLEKIRLNKKAGGAICM